MQKMLDIISYPDKKTWGDLSRRPVMDLNTLYPAVLSVFEDVKASGDEALAKYTLQFDKVELDSIKVSNEEIDYAINTLNPALKEAIHAAFVNIYKFHSSQLINEEIIETEKGVFCWRENRAIEKVGIYIPGGTAPLFSTVLMLGIPAKIAGCREIILCTPPNKDGNVHPAILYAASLVGANLCFKVGGIQAIAAMTIGTKTVPKTYKIFGPGNQYVMAAKQMAAQYGTAIDMPAGPSEVLVIADKNARPEFVASDLLSQAEHGADSQVILLTDNQNIAEITIDEIQKQLALLPRRVIAEKALENSKIIVLNSLENCMDFSNEYAPEHLILAVENAEELAQKVINAGSVFLGNLSCESAGDYASGTNHTLPTNGHAKAYSGVSVDSFVKKITFQKLTEEGVKNIGKTVEIMAEEEQLFAHKNAMTIRINYLINKQ